tara:strand:+ start:619 stop:882 length:264 start_codon:yes stop_codon:yes gene_type:complete
LEIPLPTGSKGLIDKDENHRMNIRTRWWMTQRVTYRNLAILPKGIIHDIPHEPIERDVLPRYDGKNRFSLGTTGWHTTTKNRSYSHT